MSHQNETGTLFSPSLSRRMITGGAIALTLIAFFLFSAGKGDPSWPRLWILKPLIITPLAGACGGMFYDFMAQLVKNGGWKKALAITIGVFGFIVALWIGSILGLNGTYWD
jgi:hypothetical protein